MKSPWLLLIAAVVLAFLVILNDPGRAASLGPNAAAATAASGAAATTASPEAAPDDAAAGQLVLARCGGCHSLATLQQHPQDTAGWTATVRQMEQMGAAVAPAEEPVIIRYLARHFAK